MDYLCPYTSCSYLTKKAFVLLFQISFFSLFGLLYPCIIFPTQGILFRQGAPKSFIHFIIPLTPTDYMVRWLSVIFFPFFSTFEWKLNTVLTPHGVNNKAVNRNMQLFTINSIIQQAQQPKIFHGHIDPFLRISICKERISVVLYFSISFLNFAAYSGVPSFKIGNIIQAMDLIKQKLSCFLSSSL